MLVLERKRNESFVVGEGENQITVVVARIRGNKVWLGVDAPRNVPIMRSELLVEEGQRETVRVRYRDVGQLPPMDLEDESLDAAAETGLS